MNQKQHPVVIIAPPSDEKLIREELGDSAKITASQSDLDSALETLRATSPCVAIIYLDADPAAALLLAKQAARIEGCHPVVVSRERNPDNILIAMRSGARDFAYLEDDGSDVRRAVGELVTGRESARPQTRGEVITFFSAKGGSGATTIATNLAGALAQREGGDEHLKVIVLDLDLEMGDVLVFLDATARFSFQELLSNMHRLDPDLLYNSLSQHSSGVYMMSQTDYLEEGRELSAEQVSTVVSYLVGHFDYVIIDGLRDFRDISIAALDRADHIFLTMTQDIPALKNANRCLRIFQRLGYNGNKLRLILNRFRKSGQLTPDAISDALGRKVSATVANDFPATIRAVNEGRLLINTAPSSHVAKDIDALVTLFREGDVPKRKSLFARWGKG